MSEKLLQPQRTVDDIIESLIDGDPSEQEEEMVLAYLQHVRPRKEFMAKFVNRTCSTAVFILWTLFTVVLPVFFNVVSIIEKSTNEVAYFDSCAAYTGTGDALTIGANPCWDDCLFAAGNATVLHVPTYTDAHLGLALTLITGFELFAMAFGCLTILGLALVVVH